MAEDALAVREVIYPDFTFDEPDDETSYRQALVARYPQERDAIETYFKDLHAVAGWPFQ